jgi:N6-L-threonylcarbamoyladenine synthase
MIKRSLTHILGIETSCDETAAAVVRDGRVVLSNIVASSLKEHARHGGIIPEIASRRQLEYINTVVRQALSEAKTELSGIDAIAVTGSPGLIGSLLVGISFARALSFALNKPLIEVDHIQAHAYANFLDLGEPREEKKRPPLPAVALVVSGGHTNLYAIKTFHTFRLLGSTLDDAAGEAFDKVAKILDLGYPGGPAIDRLAKEGKNTELRFNSAALPDSYDFSFSGVKTAVLYQYRDRQKHQKNFSPAQTAYAFQQSVVSVLTDKSIAACKKLKTKTLVIGGGVAANSALRAHLTAEASKNGIDVHFPPMALCTDNAAMIAGLGFHLL